MKCRAGCRRLEGHLSLERRSQYAGLSSGALRVWQCAGLYAADAGVRVSRSNPLHGIQREASSYASFRFTYSPQPGIDLSPSYYTASYPGKLREAYVKQWHEGARSGPGKEPFPETMTWNGNDYDDLKPHLWKFFEAVRSRKPVPQDAVFWPPLRAGLPSRQRILFP